MHPIGRLRDAALTGKQGRRQTLSSWPYCSPIHSVRYSKMQSRHKVWNSMDACCSIELGSGTEKKTVADAALLSGMLWGVTTPRNIHLSLRCPPMILWHLADELIKHPGTSKRRRCLFCCACAGRSCIRSSKCRVQALWQRSRTCWSVKPAGAACLLRARQRCAQSPACSTYTTL